MQKTRFFASFFVTVFLCALIGPAVADDELQTESEHRWFRNVRQLTFEKMGFERAGEAYFSADGKRICFQAVPKGKTEYQIYVMNLDGSGLKMVSTGEGATTCSYFFSDGKKMMFASNHLDQRPAVAPPDKEKSSDRSYAWPFPPGMDIFEYEFDSGKLTKLIDAEGYDAEGSYSADGKRIIFTSMRDNDQEIYICDADGKNAKRITDKPGYDGGPFFSPDGKRVVYRSDRANDGNLQIFVNNLEGTDEQQITHDPAVLHWCPFWHPSGKWLIYTRGDHRGRPNYDLYLLSPDGKETHRVTDDPTFDGLPVFSPDGKWLMWTSKRGGIEGAQVFIAEFTGLTPDGELRVHE
ncbi:MAG: PD40 domain-containing protein [Phycisphaerales bacterium]|nr:PD40 domain-containing protein [Phycisphaerales bacterium]